MHAFFSRLWDNDFYDKFQLNNKKILLIGGEEFSYKYPNGEVVHGNEYLQINFLKHGVGECEKYTLLNDYSHSSDSIGDSEGLKKYSNESFDMVVMISGLEKEDNPLVLLKKIRDLVRKGGMIYVLCRTPKTLYVKYSIQYYEDIWRFSIDDLKNIFLFDEIVKTASDTEKDFVIVGIKKTTNKNLLPLDYPLFSCQIGGKIKPSELIDKGFFRRFKELEEIGSKENTDKNRYSHNYLNKYEFFLKPWRDKEFKLLELGIFYGGSARMWNKYFTKAVIHCVDIEPVCKQYVTEGIIAHIMDLGKEENLKKLMAIRPEIIVDDASHYWTHQILALFTLFPILPSGGIYILEDLETSLNQDIFPGYDDGSEIDAYTILDRIVKVVASKVPDNNEDDYTVQVTQIGLQTELISIMKGSCILIKR